MRIGVLGAGRMASVLVPHWVGVGHDVLIGGRDRERAESVAESCGARSGTLREAASFGDAVIMAVLYQGLDFTLEAAGAAEGVLRDKVVVDLTNPVETEKFTLVSYPEGSAFARIAARTEGHVVKAFNMAEAEVWRTQPTFAGKPMSVLYASDHGQAKAIARELIMATGKTPIDAGGAEQAAYIEAATALLVRMLHSGADLTTILQPTARDR